ncbi:MAG: hypothetical protein KBC02_01035 [Candidatus Pacebacteria bacterium]|nr:hypothetical protein [Candidatus Paceibacterota bacterium]
MPREIQSELRCAVCEDGWVRGEWAGNAHDDDLLDLQRVAATQAPELKVCAYLLTHSKYWRYEAALLTLLSVLRGQILSAANFAGIDL